jgi:hypothetical protein
MNKILRKIALLGIISIMLSMTINCDILFPKKKTNNNAALVGLAILASRQNSSRAPGIYISGKLVGADSTTAIANATITFTGRGENAAIVRTGTAANTTTPFGFYQNVISTAGAGGTPQPVTMYGSTTSGAPTNTTRDTECGSTVVAMYSASTTTRVVCDSSTLDTNAKSAGISDSLITKGTAVGTITSGADGTFSGVRMENLATGNTYTLTVSGKTKTRRFRISKTGTSTLLDGTADLYLGSAAGDSIIGTSAATAEGASASSTTNPYDFSITDLQVEIVYSKPYDILTGTLGNQTLSASKDYVLSGTVIVPSGVTLTIPAGTRIYGATSPAGALLIKQGGKIDAQGTATNPIVFTSEKSTGSRSGGDWQGIIIQGNGIQTFGGRGVTAVGEGDVGTFGGSNDADNSGTMRYVRIEFAGAPFSPGNERNCLSLMGVGSGTTLEYIQCHRGYDDGFELWGGAVNMKYLVASGNRDDQFDYADGWIGRLQFAIGHLYATPVAANDDTSRCIEGDGNSAQTCAGSKRTSGTGTCSDPSIGNVTCVSFGSGQNIGDAIFVRRANGEKSGEFSHFHILNFGSQNSSDCASSGQTATLTTVNHTYTVSTAANNGCTSGGTIDQAGVALTSTSEVSPNYAPSAANTTTGTVNVNALNAAFDSATYYGAILNGGTDWTTGWTSYPTN